MYTDSISLELMSSRLMKRASSHQILYMKHIGAERSHNQMVFTTLSRVSLRESNSLSPEQLSRMWQIGLKMAKNTILTTTHKCIRSTGMLARRCKTAKTQLRYKQLSRHYGTFYVDFLKINVKSLRGYVGGMLYCDKLWFKKFFPCINEIQEESSHLLRSFIEIIGLPAALHSDNHNNLKTDLFKKTLRKFGIWSSFTEPRSPWQNMAEYAIGEVKRHARKLMQMTSTPVRL